uniref:Uncharacterized protein n=1 Tax=viral metagenome TaxID=1070528 RepID=A0A6C0F8I1_9ZZZZ|tara:strand:+ start:20636 stop:20863 length:228 start_codon:yes stop_codon:yes gene_type:complete
MNDLKEMHRFLARLGRSFKRIRKDQLQMIKDVRNNIELELLYQSYIMRILPQFEKICCLKDECKYIRKRMLKFYF